MEESLHDDVKALLDKDFGDDRILKQILRACQNDEVISNFERNYVRKLAEKHLGRKPPVELFEIPPKDKEKEETVPDVVIPEPVVVQHTQTLQALPPKITSRIQKKSKIMIGVGGTALVVIIAVVAAAAYGGILAGFSPDGDDPVAPVDVSLSIRSDLKSYDAKDLISISGNSEISGTASLYIVNHDGQIVWAEQVPIKSNGSYSTLAIAGGSGWEESGNYSLIVDNGRETKTASFTFTAS